MGSLLVQLVLLSAVFTTFTAVGAGAPLLQPPPSHARAVPITEGTEPPENPPDNYSPCSTAVYKDFFFAVTTQSTECITKTTTTWYTANSILDTAERLDLCVCKLLMQKLQKVQVPHCTEYVNGVWCPLALVLEYNFGLCNLNSSQPTANITEWPAACTPTPEPTNPITTITPSPVKTTTPSPFILTRAPSPTETQEAQDTTNHTAAIAGGTVASAASIGLAVTITLRIRQRRKEKAHHKHQSVDELEEVDTKAASAIIISEPLSPLEDSPSSATYGLHPSSPIDADK